MKKLCVLVMLGFLISGCGDDRKPIPVLNIRVLANGQYDLNGETMDKKKLYAEIQRTADENRRDIGPTSRVQVRVSAQAQSNAQLMSEVVSVCRGAGINSIYMSVADEN